MSAELVHIAVPRTDRQIVAATVDGTPMVSIRHACDAIGMEPARQIQKLNSRSWATVYMTTTVAADGKAREMAMIDRRTFTMWLATIDANRVSAAARPVIEAFQAEAADALDAYFNKRMTTAPAMNQLDVLRAALDQIEAVQRDASEARAIAAQTEARLDAIEGKHDWFSAIAYARLHELPTSTQFLRKLGGCASRIGRSHGVEPTQVQHQLYGWVNSWPAWVWDLAADGFGA
jgi:hypothetical protein